jgi:hypothetical protein
MMRIQFDKGIRPEAFSNMLLELHAKNHTRRWLQHEREFALEKHRNPFFNADGSDEFSSFDNHASSQPTRRSEESDESNEGTYDNDLRRH